VAHLPPVSTLFAALLGYNPIHNLLGPTGVLNHLSAKQVGVLTGKQFFPSVISGPFHHGLVIVFTAAAIMSFIGAMVSLLRGKQFYYDEGSHSGAGQVAAATAAPAPAASAAAAAPAGLPGQAVQVSQARRGTEPNGIPREAANGPAVTAGTSATANGSSGTANGSAHGQGTNGSAHGQATNGSAHGHGTNGSANGAAANRHGTNGSAAPAQANGDSGHTSDDDAAAGSSRGQRR
jgi:hypothetical protein